jgi:hypothetical protein
MNALLGPVDLLHDQKAVVILAKAAQPITPAADRAHEVQPEAIDVRLGFVGLELGAAADALPHGASVRRCAHAAFPTWRHTP